MCFMEIRTNYLTKSDTGKLPTIMGQANIRMTVYKKHKKAGSKYRLIYLQNIQLVLNGYFSS